MAATNAINPINPINPSQSHRIAARVGSYPVVKVSKKKPKMSAGTPPKKSTLTCVVREGREEVAAGAPSPAGLDIAGSGPTDARPATGS